MPTETPPTRTMHGRPGLIISNSAPRINPKSASRLAALRVALTLEIVAVSPASSCGTSLCFTACVSSANALRQLPLPPTFHRHSNLIERHSQLALGYISERIRLKLGQAARIQFLLEILVVIEYSQRKRDSRTCAYRAKSTDEPKHV